MTWQLSVLPTHLFHSAQLFREFFVDKQHWKQLICNYSLFILMFLIYSKILNKGPPKYRPGSNAKFIPLLSPRGYRSMGLKSGCVIKSRRKAIF